MKYNYLVLLTLFVCACSTNPHKAKEIETNLEHKEDAGQGVTLGLNKDGEMVTQKKMKMVDYLRILQREVYELEYEIYGNRELGRKGMFGALTDCLDEARSKKLGGDGKASALPQKSVLTSAEDFQFSKIGLDEKKELVAVTEEFLADRIKRFEGYKANYNQQRDDFEDRLRICKASLNEKKQTVETK